MILFPFLLGPNGIKAHESNSTNYRVLHQPVRPLKIYHNSRYSIDEFFSLGSEIKLYEKKQNHILKSSIIVYGSYFGTFIE